MTHPNGLIGEVGRPTAADSLDIGGFALTEAQDKDTAIEIAKRSATSRLVGGRSCDLLCATTGG